MSKKTHDSEFVDDSDDGDEDEDGPDDHRSQKRAQKSHRRKTTGPATAEAHEPADNTVLVDVDWATVDLEWLPDLGRRPLTSPS